MIRSIKCKRCPQRIVFLKTKAGNDIPVNIETWKPGDLLYDHARHTPHFATCPAAARFRKKKPGNTHTAGKEIH